MSDDEQQEIENLKERGIPRFIYWAPNEKFWVSTSVPLHSGDSVDYWYEESGIRHELNGVVDHIEHFRSQIGAAKGKPIMSAKIVLKD